MDHKGLKFEKTWLGELTELERDWLEPIDGLSKVDYRTMLMNLKSGVFQLWRLKAPASGVAVTVPQDGRLFIYYLHGHRLFDTLTMEDLLAVARQEKLSGMSAEVGKLGVMKLLRNRGFKLVEQTPAGRYYMELSDGG